MGSLIPGNGNLVSAKLHEMREISQPASNEPTVLVATIDSAISSSMRELLQMYPLKAIWAKGLVEVRAALTKQSVAACFCGFWLVDGTYRDVVRHPKRQPVEIPTIILCEPACSHEYRDYLAALNIRAFDFICHPYSKGDLERILRAATLARGRQSAWNQSGLQKAG